MLEGEENEDSKAISDFTKDTQKRKRARTDGNEDTGTGARGSGAADHAVLVSLHSRVL